jgi:fatty acid amide hydrolase 2
VKRQRNLGYPGSSGRTPIDPLLELSTVELARRIREGEIGSVDVVERHIARIEEVNSRLNAVVRDRFAQARVEAKQADERVRTHPRPSLPPLLGVPCTIKESIALEGMPHSSGVVARAEVVARADAPPVARVRAAGAIPLGVTNVPELTAHTSTFNQVYGRTSNAYDDRHSAGGSSGGEGAIVGAGGSPFGIGTDIGGSIRVPSFCNGVFGHKPTGGLVPGSGQVPLYSGVHCRTNVTGPIARRAEDLMPLLRVVAGPDGTDPECRALPLGEPASVNLAALRVYSVEGDGRRPRVQEELRHAQQRAAFALARNGATVELPSLPELGHAIWFYAGLALEEGHGPLPSDLGEGKPVPLARELLRWALRRSHHTYPPLLLNVVARLGLRRPDWIRRGAQRARSFRTRLEDLLGDDGVMLYPTACGPAPRHGSDLLSTNFRFTGLFNALELPVTQVPLGIGRHGLPLGVQVVGARGRDHVTIAAALELERTLGGWVPPPEARSGPEARGAHSGAEGFTGRA